LALYALSGPAVVAQAQATSLGLGSAARLLLLAVHNAKNRVHWAAAAARSSANAEQNASSGEDGNVPTTMDNSGLDDDSRISVQSSSAAAGLASTVARLRDKVVAAMEEEEEKMHGGLLDSSSGTTGLDGVLGSYSGTAYAPYLNAAASEAKGACTDAEKRALALDAAELCAAPYLQSLSSAVNQLRAAVGARPGLDWGSSSLGAPAPTEQGVGADVERAHVPSIIPIPDQGAASSSDKHSLMRLVGSVTYVAA